MNKKILLVILTLFVAYNIFIYLLQAQKYVPQSIDQENNIKIQEFFYSKEAKDHIVVGSSVAAKLDEELSKGKLYNLAFRGKSVLDGMLILKASGISPKTILIETNTLQRQVSLKENDLLLNPILRQVKAYLPALQYKNQPVNMFILGLDEGFKSAKSLFSAGNSKKLLASNPVQQKNTPQSSPEEQKFLQQIVKAKIKEYNSLLNPEQKAIISQNLKDLQAHIDYFKKKKVRIIFFEMPAHEALMKSPGFQYLRQEVRKSFPHTDYEYIKDVNPNDFKTKDGVHLIPESAQRYTRLLINEFEALK